MSPEARRLAEAFEAFAASIIRRAAEAAPKSDRAPGLTRSEVAAALNVGLSTLTKWRKAGTFPPPDYRVGGVRRWRPETVAAWRPPAS